MPEEIEVKIHDIIQRTSDVKSFRFRLEKEIIYKPGQFLQATIIVDKQPLSRYLSISSSPTEYFIEFTKKLTTSPFSNALDIAKIGDPIRLKLPMGTFTFTGEYKKAAFLSGGIGITPIKSICRYAADTKLSSDMILLYSNRTSKDIAFKQDLDQMQKQDLNLKVIYFITDEENKSPGPDVRIGRINKDAIIKEVPDYKDRVYYTCGPPKMVEVMRCILSEDLKLEKDLIRYENFSGY